MRDVVIIGVGMTPFGKYNDKSLQDLGREAVWNALDDANVKPKDIQVAYASNALSQQLTEVKGTVGQHVLTSSGIFDIPIINVENACSSGSTALRGACLEVSSGNKEIALAFGAEKMYCGDTSKATAAMASGTIYGRMGFMFVALYAMRIRKWMETYGVTKEHIAKVVVKNKYNGSLNPYAQFKQAMSLEEILNSRMIAEPLTQYMCSSIADGGAAAIVTTRNMAKRFNSKPPIEVAACELISTSYNYSDDSHIPIATRAANAAYQTAGIGPNDIDVVELHDPMAPAELILYEELGLCRKGEGIRILEEGITAINGSVPVNPSGGLSAKGHPVGATGLAQIAEIVWQLRGEAGKRQITNNPKVGVTENNGGHVLGESAACAVTILKK